MAYSRKRRTCRKVRSPAFAVVVRKTGGVLFGEEVVGYLADVVYSDGSRYVVRIESFSEEDGFHTVQSCAWNFSTGVQEEPFADVLDLSILYRTRRLQFLSHRTAVCPDCQLQLCGFPTYLRHMPVSVCPLCQLTTHTHCHRTCRLVTGAVAARRRAKKLPPSEVQAPQEDTNPTCLRELQQEYLALQGDGDKTRRFVFLASDEFVRQVAGNDVHVALESLRGCATNGVLTWTLSDGSESENVGMLRRALCEKEDRKFVLLVAVLEVNPLADQVSLVCSAVHRTFGFVLLDRMRGSVALFGCRSSHLRSIDELWSVLTDEEDPPIWSVAGAAATVTHKAVYAEYQVKQGTRQILDSIKCQTMDITRDDFRVDNYKLVHHKLPTTPDIVSDELIASPARLLLGLALRVLQTVIKTRVVLLELALPICGVVKQHGHGRKVEVVVKARLPQTSGGAYMPQRGDRVLELTANASAYKIYRAFGFGEHVVFNRLPLANQHPEFLYPVLGCVLEISDDGKQGGISAQQINDIASRKIPGLKGIPSWLPSLRSDDAHELIAQLRDFDAEQTTSEERKFLNELHYFEQVLDKITARNLGVSEDEVSGERRDHSYSTCSAASTGPSTPTAARMPHETRTEVSVRRSCRLASKAKDRQLLLHRQTSYSSH